MTEGQPHAWFDEIDLDPALPWRRMGARSLGDRPWLVPDDRAGAELSLKADLLASRHHEVVARCGDDDGRAGTEVRDLIAAEGRRPDMGDPDPLTAAARVVQEDLCLLRPRDGAWHLDAACVCFPSRWCLADKIGRPLRQVHAPVAGYANHLDRRVEHLLDRIGERPVLRRNWFVHPDGALFQPSAPAVDPVIASDDALTELHFRSERQTLRRLASGWMLFTIRVQHGPVGEVLSTPARHARFVDHLARVPAEALAHRGMAPAQVTELLSALGGR